jgi:hypothetical protein
LQISNVTFETHPTESEESVVKAEPTNWLQLASELFGVEEFLLQRALLYKKIMSGGKRTSIGRWLFHRE